MRSDLSRDELIELVTGGGGTVHGAINRHMTTLMVRFRVPRAMVLDRQCDCGIR